MRAELRGMVLVKVMWEMTKAYSQCLGPLIPTRSFFGNSGGEMNNSSSIRSPLLLVIAHLPLMTQLRVIGKKEKWPPRKRLSRMSLLRTTRLMRAEMVAPSNQRIKYGMRNEMLARRNRIPSFSVKQALPKKARRASKGV